MTILINGHSIKITPCDLFLYLQNTVSSNLIKEIPSER